MAIVPNAFNKSLFIKPEIASAFLCIKCNLICLDIHEINCSKGHLCCKSCWNNNNMTSCILCNESINIDIKRSRFVEGQQFKLEIKCPNIKCEWNDTFNKLSLHLSKECPFRKLKCQHCNKLFIYKQFTIHRETCNYLPVSCPLSCDKNKKWLRMKISSHLKTECPNYIVKCNYFKDGCKEKLKRHEMNQHLQNKCLYRIVECPFIKYGCDIKEKSMHYHQLKKHLNEYQLKHLSLRMIAMSDQLQNIQISMNSKFNQQSKQIEFLQRKLKYQTNKNNSIINDINNINSLSNDCNGLLIFCGSKNGSNCKQNSVEWINIKNKTKHILFNNNDINNINNIYNHQYMHLAKDKDDNKEQEEIINSWDIDGYSICTGYNISFNYIQPYLLNSSFGNNTSGITNLEILENKEFWNKELVTLIFRCGGYLSQTEQKLSRVDGFILETNDFFQLPYMNDILFGSAVIYSHIYGLIVCGGKNDKNISVNTMQRLITSQENNNILKWEYLPSMIEKRYNPSICIWKDMKSMNYNESELLIVCGGNNETNGYLKSCSIYDFNSKEFHEISDMNIPRSSHSLIHWKYRNKCIVVGGINKDNSSSKSIEEYDLIKDQWYSLPNMNQLHRKHPSVWIDNSLIYNTYNGVLCVSGGDDHDHNLGHIEILDTRLNKWQTIGHLSSLFFQSDQYKNTVFRRTVCC